MTDTSKRQITISGRDFIRGPYRDCPKCGQHAFGVLMIRDDSYLRRCRECFHPQGHEHPAEFPLPALSKKVVYIDQMGISNMMKAFNPSTPPARAERVPKFWAATFDRLDVLAKLQLTVCPKSRFHEWESLMTADFEALRRMYEHMSCDVSFYDPDTIERSQILEQLDIWLGEKREPTLDVHRIVDGDINTWLKELRFSTSPWRPPELLDELRQNRRKADEHLAKVFQRWRREKSRSFEDWFEEERRSTASMLAECFRNQLAKIVRMGLGLAPFDAFEFLPDMATQTIHEIRDTLQRTGKSDEEVNRAMGDFLCSETFMDAPHIKIRSLMYAGLARQAALGRKKPPGRGCYTDVRLIATLLPYCDAMFVDDEWGTILTQAPVRDRLGYPTQIFSAATHQEFFAYLDAVKATAPSAQLNAVEEVYGPDWARPYRELYESGASESSQ